MKIYGLKIELACSIIIPYWLPSASFLCSLSTGTGDFSAFAKWPGIESVLLGVLLFAGLVVSVAIPSPPSRFNSLDLFANSLKNVSYGITYIGLSNVFSLLYCVLKSNSPAVPYIGV